MKAGKYNYYLYNMQLQTYANNLRHRMTKAEACLWKYVLSAGNMKGFGFRRQRPVLNYIADFMCKDLMLIIEVDGISHDNEDAMKYDAIRQQALENAGFTVLRFRNGEVLTAIDQVKEMIEDWIDRKGIPPPPPHQRRRIPPKPTH